MKIRWREHEILLIIVSLMLLFGGNLWYLHTLSPAEIQNIYGAGFINNHVPFNVYRNMILPQAGEGLLIFLSLLWVNLLIIPRLLAPSKAGYGTFRATISLEKIALNKLARAFLKRGLWLVIQMVLLILFLGAGLTVVSYYLEQFAYFFPAAQHGNYGIFIHIGFRKAFDLLLPYLVYACARELFIRFFIETSGHRRAYRVLISNQVTGFLVVIILVALVLRVFDVIHDSGVFAMYFGCLLSVFLVFESNLYWLFPLKGKSPFFSLRVILRLLLSTFLFSLPFTIIMSLADFSPLPVFFAAWVMQLLVVTPVSWIVYQQRKDKILQLRGAEKALVKSKTDLQFLRSQINPHFLFNILNTLYGTALQEKAALTAEGIQKLGDMMRFMLHENNLDFIQMSRETGYLKNYISLEKLRTQSSPGIIIEDNINEQHCNHLIAPMLLIPFVENAFKHGISLKEKSWIQIKLDCDEKNIFFEVRNSMHQKQDNDPEKERSGIGFKNVLERLKLLYPGKHQLTVNADNVEFLVLLAIQP